MLGFIFTRAIASLLLLHSFHAVHISYGDLTISQDSTQDRSCIIRGNFTFFKDDWAKATEHWFGKDISTEPKAMQNWMESEYLKEHIRFWADGFSERITFVPRVKDDAGQSVTYEFSAAIPPNHRAIIIDSRAVLSEYSDQMNLMTVKIHGETTNLIFTSDHTTSTIKL
jgi:hypothetical protein